MNGARGMFQKRSTRWVVAGVAVLLVASAILATGGALKNQTSVSTQTGGEGLLGLVPSNPTSSVNGIGGHLEWRVTTANAILSPYGSGFRIVASSTIAYPEVVVAETVGLSADASELSYLHLGYRCPVGVQVVLALGWPGLNTPAGEKAVANLSKYPDLLAGVESQIGVVWFNSGYPSSAIQCSGRDESLVVDMKQEFAKYGLPGSAVGGIQLKAVVPGPLSNETVLSVRSTVTNGLPYSYALSGIVGTKAPLFADGSAVVITPPTNLPAEGYYPKRTFISYDMSAAAGTTYTIFAVTKHNGATYLFSSYQAFSHSNSTTGIGTTVDFVNGEKVNGTIEPLASLSSLLTGGEIAIIFVPVGQSAFNSVGVASVQTTWGLLPFGTSGFVPQASGSWPYAAVAYMLSLSTVIPALVTMIVWAKYREGLRDPKKFALVVAGAAALRFALAPVTGSIDTDNFAATASVYFSSGAFGVDWVNLPGFPYAEILSYFPYAVLRSLGFVDWSVLSHSTYALETVFVKTPSVLADLGLGIMLSKFAGRYRPDLKGLVLVLYLFNPLTVYLSGVYGQYDDLFVLLLVASLYAFFALGKPLLTGVLLGSTVLVNPVGLAAWLPVLAIAAGRRDLKAAFSTCVSGSLTLALGIVPLLVQPNSVFQTTFERLLSAIPGDPIVGTVLQFPAFGESHVSSVGYGLDFRMLLELAGSSLGFYFYPLAAGVAFLILTYVMLDRVRRVPSGAVLASAFVLGVVALFDLFFPTVFLQFALWPFVLLLVMHLMTGKERYLDLSLHLSIVSGMFYVVLVDNPLDKAAGLAGGLFADLHAVNSAWAMIGLVFSVLMAYAVFLSVRSMTREAEP